MTDVFGLIINLPPEVTVLIALFAGLVLGAGGVTLGKRR